MIGLLVLAFAAKNVSVQSATGRHGADRETIADTLTEGGVLTSDQQVVHDAARRMLTAVLSLPGEHDRQRHRRSRRWRGDRCFPQPAEHGHGGVPLLPLQGRDREGGRRRRRARRSARQGHAGAADREVRVREYVYPRALFRLTEQDLEVVKQRRRTATSPGRGYGGDEPPDGRRRWRHSRRTTRRRVANIRLRRGRESPPNLSPRARNVNGPGPHPPRPRTGP